MWALIVQGQELSPVPVLVGVAAGRVSVHGYTHGARAAQKLSPIPAKLGCTTHCSFPDGPHGRKHMPAVL